MEASVMVTGRTGRKLASVIEEMARLLEAAGQKERAASLRGDVPDVSRYGARSLDVERMVRIWGGMAALTGVDVPGVVKWSRKERLRTRLSQAFEG